MSREQAPLKGSPAGASASGPAPGSTQRCPGLCNQPAPMCRDIGQAGEYLAPTPDSEGLFPIVLTKAMLLDLRFCHAFFQLDHLVADLANASHTLWNAEDIFVSLVATKVGAAALLCAPAGLQGSTSITPCTLRGTLMMAQSVAAVTLAHADSEWRPGDGPAAPGAGAVPRRYRGAGRRACHQPAAESLRLSQHLPAGRTGAPCVRAHGRAAGSHGGFGGIRVQPAGCNSPGTCQEAAAAAAAHSCLVACQHTVVLRLQGMCASAGDAPCGLVPVTACLQPCLGTVDLPGLQMVLVLGGNDPGQSAASSPDC